MTREELLSRTSDTGIQDETLSIVLESLIKNGKVNVRSLSLPSDKKAYSATKIDEFDPIIIAKEVIIFKRIVEKLSTLDIEKFSKYNIDNFKLSKLLRLKTQDISEYIVNGTIPNGDLSISDVLKIIKDMSLIALPFGSQVIDIFEESKQDTKYKNKNTDRKKECEHYTKRIYLNIPLNKLAVDFLTTYKLKCIQKGIPSKMKGMGSSGYEPGNLDTTILYSNDYYLMDHINIIEEIIKEKPDLVCTFGTPVISGGRVTSEDGNCYYTLSSGLLNDSPSNTYYSKLYKIAYTYLCAEYLNSPVEIVSLCNMSPTQLKELREKLASSLTDDIKNKMRSEGKYKDAVKKVSSYLRFGDLEHEDVPLYQDEIFASFFSKSVIKAEDEEKELFLYNTEDLINNVLDIYQRGDSSFDELMSNYFRRMYQIYRLYMSFAFMEPNFVLSDRHKEVSSIFDRILTCYEIPRNMTGIEKIEFYKHLQSGINEYLNSRGK